MSVKMLYKMLCIFKKKLVDTSFVQLLNSITMNYIRLVYFNKRDIVCVSDIIEVYVNTKSINTHTALIRNKM